MLTRGADITLALDRADLCSGFVVVRPTPAAIRLLSETVAMAAASPANANDQMVLNRAISVLKANLTVVRLGRQRWPSGADYFGQRANNWANAQTVMDRKACSDNRSSCPAIVHNNFIVSKSAKVYVLPAGKYCS